MWQTSATFFLVYSFTLLRQNKSFHITNLQAQDLKSHLHLALSKWYNMQEVTI